MIGTLWDENFVLIEDTREKAARIAKKKASSKKVTAEKIINSTNFTLEDTGVMTDAEGIALGNSNTATCTLTSTMQGTMRVGYDIGLSNVTPSTNITTLIVPCIVDVKVHDAELPEALIP